MTKEITFPFTPNDKVKKAFASARKRRLASRVLIEELLECLSNDEDGFEVLRREHPGIIKYDDEFRYNFRTGMIEHK